MSFIFLVSGLSLHEQVNSITESDLCGCWIFDSPKNNQRLKKNIFISCKFSGSKLSLKKSKLIFLANKCEFQEVKLSSVICLIIKI